ncbi:MAG: cold shock domain-containing protein [Nanoarchaeota archaeon]|nr:cold shock domain-containing protein [Nanoarchaeota archaeon]MBU1855076.1 cold shock domain-containing protein [Nanoarchaeota archaeon]
MKGKVKFFNMDKRFGFITGDDGKDYFVHLSQVVDQVALREEDEVEFDGSEGDRGLVANNVKKE